MAWIYLSGLKHPSLSVSYNFSLFWTAWTQLSTARAYLDHLSISFVVYLFFFLITMCAILVSPILSFILLSGVISGEIPSQFCYLIWGIFYFNFKSFVLLAVVCILHCLKQVWTSPIEWSRYLAKPLQPFNWRTYVFVRNSRHFIGKLKNTTWESHILVSWDVVSLFIIVPVIETPENILKVFATDISEWSFFTCWLPLFSNTMVKFMNRHILPSWEARSDR